MMANGVNCPHCDALMPVVTELVGKRVRCPVCHSEFHFTWPSNERSCEPAPQPRSDSTAYHRAERAYRQTCRESRPDIYATLAISFGIVGLVFVVGACVSFAPTVLATIAMAVSLVGIFMALLSHGSSSFKITAFALTGVGVLGASAILAWSLYAIWRFSQHMSTLRGFP